MIKHRHILYSVFLIASTLFLTACKLELLEPKGIIAADEKHILLIATLLMLLVVIPVIAMTFIFAWKYRESNTKASYTPNWSHNTMIEIVCWTIPLIIIGILGYITWTSTHRLDPYKPLSNEKHLKIQVIALEWKWLFIYPEQKIATINFVQFPVNKPVEFLITSEGPMNSFQIPQLAGQIYAMAGMQTKLHLSANQIGDFRGMSASFSGDGFSGMKFIARASSEADFDKWVLDIHKTKKQLTKKEYGSLLQKSINDPAQYFSLGDDAIYHMAIMKYMMPMDE